MITSPHRLSERRNRTQRWSPLASVAYSTRIPIRRAAESVDGYREDGGRDSLDVIEIYIGERKGR